MTTFTVVLTGGSPWGFRLQGGREFNEPIKIAKINPNSKAFYEGIQVDDTLVAINGHPTHGLNHSEVQTLIKNASGGTLGLQLQRETNTVNGHVNGGPLQSPITPGGSDAVGEPDPSSPVLQEVEPPSMNGLGRRSSGSSTTAGMAAAWSPSGSGGSSIDYNNSSSFLTNNNSNNSYYHHSNMSPPPPPPPPPPSDSVQTTGVTLPLDRGRGFGKRQPLPVQHTQQPPQQYQNQQFRGPPHQQHPQQQLHPRPSPVYNQQQPHHRQTELNVEHYPPSSSSSQFSSSSSFHSSSPSSLRKPTPDINQWAAHPRHNDTASPTGHAPISQPPEVSHQSGRANVPPHLDHPQPLPFQYPHPPLRPIVPPSPTQGFIYKPFPDQPPPPEPENQPLSPKLKHRLVTPPKDSMKKQAQPQRQIHQHMQQPHHSQHERPPQDPYHHQPLSPTSYSDTVPMRNFINQLQEELKSPPPTKGLSIKQQYEEYQRRQKLEQQNQQTQKQPLQQRQAPHSQQPRYPASHQPGHQYSQQQPQRPQHFDIRSPSLRAGGGRDPRSPPHSRSHIYRPSADILHRGSPTPSLPADFLRHKQASPTPSVTSTSSEYVLSGGRGRPGSKSRGMNLFLKQQERLAAMGADVQDITISEGRDRSKSLQNSPNVQDYYFGTSFVGPRRLSGPAVQQQEKGAKSWGPPSRSISVDAGTRRIPIPVHHAGPSKPTPSTDIPITPQRTRRYSEEESSSVSGPAPGSSKLSSSWQSSPGRYLPYQDNKGRDFAPGSYATLPTKGSKQRAHHEPFDSTDSRRTDFDFSNPYSTLPTIKPLKSSSTAQTFNEPKPSEGKKLKNSQSYDFTRRDLEHTLDYKDFSKPLWANTDLGNLQRNSFSSQDDGHSPHSDNAISSSDSRDTIIAKDERSSAESLPIDIPIEMRSQEKPAVAAKPVVSPKPKGKKIMPITVVHEQPSKPPSVLSPTSFSTQGPRVDGQDSFSTLPASKPSHAYPFSDTPSEYRQNGPASNEFHGIGYSPQRADAWGPGTQTLPARSKIEGRESKPSPPETSLKNIAPVWKPGGPSLGIKKEYRPVRLDTSRKPQVQHKPQEQVQVASEESFAWKPQPRIETANTLPTYTPLDTSSVPVFQKQGPASKPFSPPITGDQPDSRHMNGDGGGEDTRLPPTQSPYITLLQKSRDTEDTPDFNDMKFVGKPIVVQDDGQLPKGAVYIGSKHSTEGDQSVTETYYTTPGEKTTTKQVIEHKAPVKYDGIGPVDQEGVPLAFRKNVGEENQHDWYKQMYKSLHKTEKKEDRLGINAMIDSIFEEAEPNTYRPSYTFPDDISDTKSEEGLDVRPYRPSYGKPRSKVDDSGYRSEPEGKNKDWMKFRSKSTSDSRESRRNVFPSVRSKIEVYRCQPRSIMDYEPGFSSIALREAKSHTRPRSKSVSSPREKKKKPHNPRIDKPGDFSQYSENYRDPDQSIRADGDGGEESEPSEAYKKIQHGGDIPIRGLQKPAPEKTKMCIAFSA